MPLFSKASAVSEGETLSSMNRTTTSSGWVSRKSWNQPSAFVISIEPSSQTMWQK